jgi:cytochrome c553
MSHSIYTCITTLLLGVFGFHSSVHAWTMTGDQEEAMTLTPNLENGRVLYETCAICHTPTGWGTPDGRYPEIAGQHFNVIIKQMADIRNGNRDNPTMYPFTLDNILPDNQALADVAGYISQLPMNPRNATGPGHDLAHGEALYKEYCVKCHGDNGEGDNDDFYPRIHGQTYQYLLRQMFWIKNGKRRNADPTMVEQIKGFTARDIYAVIDYSSRLHPPPEDLAKDMAPQVAPAYPMPVPPPFTPPHYQIPGVDKQSTTE